MSKNLEVLAITARSILNKNPKELMDKLNGPIKVVFEDGNVVDIHGRHILISAFLWQPLNKFPELPIISDYVVNNYYTNDMYTGSTHNKLYSRIFRDIIENVLIPKGLDNPDSIDEIYGYMMDAINFFYNEFTFSKLEYVMSVDIDDLLELQLEPDLMKDIAAIKKVPDLDNVNNSYTTVDTLIRSDKYRHANPLARSYISGAISARQVNQVLGARGFVTELDSTIFKTPIANSFTLGLSNMYEIAAESRSCAKALHLSNEAIRTSEHFAKEIQLGAMSIERIVYEDCGTKEYTDWFVRPKEVSYGATIYKGDFNYLIGKKYLNEKTGKEEYITEEHQHIIGTKIKLRTTLGCKHKDPKKVCAACFGKLSYSVPKHFNIGHFATTSVTRDVSQNILSTKHITVSAAVANILLDNQGSKYFTVKNKNSYSVKPEYIKTKSKNLKLVLSQKSCFGLVELNGIKNLNKIDPARTTRIGSMVVIEEFNGNVKDYSPVKVSNGNRYGHLETRFLEYILEHGYTLDDDGNYIFDLSEWTSAMPIITLPEIEFSYLQFADEVIKLLKYRKMSKGEPIDTPESLLSRLFTLLNGKLDINIALIEIIILSFTIKGNGNYDLGRLSPTRKLASLSDVITKRSLGPAFGWGYIRGTMLSPISFVPDNRTNHVLDVLIKPNEHIKASMSRKG